MTYYYRSGGKEYIIHCMIDIDGDEVEDPDDAVLVTIRDGMSRWTVEVQEGDIIRK